MKVLDIYNWIDSFAPWSSKMEGDNVGLIVGSMDSDVTKIGTCLDITAKTIAEAEKLGCDLILSHHPVIFGGIKSLDTKSPVYLLAQSGISALCAHTNLDAALGGVNCGLAEILGLSDIKPLEGSSDPALARIGKLKKPVSARSFAQFAAKALHTSVRLKDSGKPVETVAVCGGAASDYIALAESAGADLYLTSEIKQHEWIAASISVIDGGHYPTESAFLPMFTEKIVRQFPLIEVTRLNESAPYECIGE
jgi:dinuclear metal center YbgI/SA1388 family protein